MGGNGVVGSTDGVVATCLPNDDATVVILGKLVEAELTTRLTGACVTAGGAAAAAAAAVGDTRPPRPDANNWPPVTWNT